MFLFKSSEKTNDLRKKSLLMCLIVGPMIINLGWLFLGVFTPPVHTEYGIIGGINGMITNPISGLGVGPNVVLFNSAFILSGVFMIIGLFGLFYIHSNKNQPIFHWIAFLLLSVPPIGLVGCSIFTLKVSVALHMIALGLGGGTSIISFIIAGIYFGRVYGWKIFGKILIAGGPLILILTTFIMFRTYIVN
jgi:hypothetical protein